MLTNPSDPYEFVSQFHINLLWVNACLKIQLADLLCDCEIFV